MQCEQGRMDWNAEKDIYRGNEETSWATLVIDSLDYRFQRGTSMVPDFQCSSDLRVIAFTQLGKLSFTF